jgi:hypothetical protein
MTIGFMREDKGLNEIKYYLLNALLLEAKT